MLPTQTDVNANSENVKILNNTPKIPEWITADKFDLILRQNVQGYKKTENFKAYPALATGENYLTLMLRVEIEVELDDGSNKQVSFMLKVPIDNPIMKEMMEKHNVFDIEKCMYVDVVPELEQMLRAAGVDVTFGAKCHQFEKDTILLEDLRPRGFKNAKRQDGLDMEHTKCVLKKVAQFHAASATRVAIKGSYAVNLTEGLLIEDNRSIMDEMHHGFELVLNKCIGTYKDFDLYAESTLKMLSNLTEEMFKLSVIDDNEFNVLNHGDCWCNNIMFQYDTNGKVKETYLVDYQIPKFGTPALDLYYFLFSSTKLELKLTHFDFFIRYYYDNLLEHLQLLKYPKKLPTLRDIHVMLVKYGLWGFVTSLSAMAAVLLEPNENASFDNFIGNSDEGSNFKMQMFGSPRYRQHIETILLWLYNRGALESTI